MFSEKALYALVQEDLLIFGEVFRMQRFHIGHLVIPVEEFIFALTHLVEGEGAAHAKTRFHSGAQQVPLHQTAPH